MTGRSSSVVSTPISGAERLPSVARPVNDETRWLRVIHPSHARARVDQGQKRRSFRPRPLLLGGRRRFFSVEDEVEDDQNRNGNAQEPQDSVLHDLPPSIRRRTRPSVGLGGGHCTSEAIAADPPRRLPELLSVRSPFATPRRP